MKPCISLYLRQKMPALFLALCLSVPLIPAVPTYADTGGVYYVRAEADAKAWRHAPPNRVYSDLQAAIDDAAKNAPSRVLVTVGVFSPASAPNTGGGNERGFHFSLRNGVTVIGGFAGDELVDVPTYENNPGASEEGRMGNPGLLRPAEGRGKATVLSGMGGVDHVFYHPDSAALDQSAALINVTVAMGGADGVNGGGMFNNECSPTLINCLFANNGGALGGGVYNDFASPLFENCRFEENTAAESGGAMYNLRSAPSVVNCSFTSNRAAQFGGAMANEKSAPVITNTAFNENSTLAADGGGVFIGPDSAPTFTHCTFTGNSSAHYGGAIAARNSSPRLINCCFTKNEGLYGGALYGESGALTATNCSFINNSGSGGGGLYAEKSAVLKMAGCDFTKNYAGEGGGMFLYMSFASLYNCAFMENVAEKGGGACNTGGVLHVTNGVFAGNNASEEGGGISSGSTAHSDSRLNLTNCTFTANTADYANRGAGVFSGDYSATIANSIISGNNSPDAPLTERDGESAPTRRKRASDFIKAETSPDPVYVNNVVGSVFYADYNNYEDVGFDPSVHFNMDYSLAPENNPATDRGSVSMFSNAFSSFKASIGENRLLTAYDARGCERFGAGVNAPVDLGAFESFAPKRSVTPPSPVLTAVSGGKPYASGAKTNSLVEISAAVDIEAMNNFPLLPRVGFLPLQIFCDRAGEDSAPYTKTIVSQTPETFEFYTALDTIAASSKVAFETKIDTRKPGVANVRFGDSDNSWTVPVATKRVGVSFTNNIRATATSATRLYELEDGGAPALAADLSARALASGTELRLDLNGVALKNGQKYMLDMSGYKDEYNNAMDSFKAYFVTEAVAGGDAPAVTALLAANEALPHTGGEASLTITGSDLGQIDGLAVTDGFNVYAATADASGGFATVTPVRLPENTEDSAMVYTFRVIAGEELADTGKSQHISVEAKKRDAVAGTSLEAASMEAVLTDEFTQDVASTESAQTEAAQATEAQMEAVVNGSPVTLAGLTTDRDGYALELNSVDGSASLVVKASDLERLAGKNSRFALNITTPFGSYALPADLAARVPDYDSTLRDCGVSGGDVKFRLTMTDMSKNEGVLREVEQKFGSQALKSGITGLALDILDADGKAIKNIKELKSGVTIQLNISPGFTPSAYSGVFCLNESGDGRKLMFVPHGLGAGMAQPPEDSAVTAETHTNGIFFVAEHRVTFDDIANHWAKKAIEQTASLTLVAGVGENRFAPDQPLSRAEFANMVASALFLPKAGTESPYPDTPKEAWYYGGVMRAKSAGLLNGLPGVGFGPDTPITREEAASIAAAAMLYKSRASRGEPASLHMTFSDYQDINEGYAYDVQTVVAMNIMSGQSTDEFSPKAAATRAQGAVIIQKILAALA